MEKSKNDLPQYLVWTIFFVVLCMHLFLAVKWQGQFFIRTLGNLHSFTEAVSRAYQDMALSQHGFSIFYKFNSAGVGNHWPTAVFTMRLWTFWVLPIRWFFLPNFFFLAMIMLGIYYSTRFLIHNNLYSLIAAIIFSCYWFVMIQLVAYEVQLAATACIVWGFYWYLRSFFFTRFWPSLLVGLWMVFALYCDRVTPGLFVFALFLVPRNFQKKRSWFLMALTLILVALGTWPFYKMWVMSSFGNPAATALLFSQQGDFSPPAEAYRAALNNPQFLFVHLSYYFISLTEKLLGYGFTALWILGMFLIHRLKKPYAQVLWTALLIPLSVFIGIIKKDYIYIFPLCIYFAMISGLGIYFIRKKWLRGLLILLVAGLAIQQCFALFDPSPIEGRGLFFSSQFKKMRIQRNSKLELSPFVPIQENLANQLQSIANQIRPIINTRVLSGEQKQAMIVDLEEEWLQQAGVFFLRGNFPKMKIMDNAFASDLGFKADCHEDYRSMYLLSNKERWAVQNSSGNVGGCFWKSLEVLLRLPDSEITLYRAEQ